MINEDFPCSLKKIRTPAKGVRFLFRYVAYWGVKMRKEKIDPTALFDRESNTYRRFAPRDLGLTIIPDESMV
jgi:hypothetical protein